MTETFFVQYEKRNKTMQIFLLEATPALSNWLVDALVLLCIIGGVISAAKKGFVECFFKFISTLVAIMGAILLAGAVLEWTGGLFGMQDGLTESFSETFSKGAFAMAIPSAEALAVRLKEELSLPDMFVELIVEWYVEQNFPMGMSLGAIFGGAIARLLSLLIVGVILFILIKLLLKLLSKVLTAIIEKIPLVGTANTLLGALVGLLETWIIVQTILPLLAFLSQTIGGFIENCVLLNFIMETNLVMIIIGLVF